MASSNHPLSASSSAAMLARRQPGRAPSSRPTSLGQCPWPARLGQPALVSPPWPVRLGQCALARARSSPREMRFALLQEMRDALAEIFRVAADLLFAVGNRSGLCQRLEHGLIHLLLDDPRGAR